MPPLDSPEMKEWLSQIDFDNIPDVSPTGLGGCANATNAMAVQNGGEDGACWWTCGGWCVPFAQRHSPFGGKKALTGSFFFFFFQQHARHRHHVLPEEGRLGSFFRCVFTLRLSL